MVWKKELQKILSNYLEARKSVDPKYSLRSLAKEMKISAGAVSQLLRGSETWHLMPERACEMVEYLDIPERQKKRFANLTGARAEIPKKQMAWKDYETLTDWTYNPVLMSYDLPGQPTPALIAARLGIDEKKAVSVTEDLLRRGLLERTEDGRIRRAEVFWDTTDCIPSEIIRRHHEGNLEVARRALEKVPLEKRDFTSLTFAGSKSQIEFLRKEIRALHDRAVSLMGTENNDEVFQLTIGLFPFDFGGETAGETV